MTDKIRAASPAVIEFAETNNIDLSKVAGTGPGGRVSLEDVKAAMPEPYVTPLVAKLAAENSIDLRAVAGTGIGGRIRKSDVLRAAGKLPAASVEPADEIERLAPGLRADLAAGVAAANYYRDRNAAARGPEWARNPLVDQVRAQASAAGTPMPTSNAPSLFPSGGDTPTFTASGIPPESVLHVPWQARHAMAAAPTAADAYAIATACSGPDGEVHAQMHHSNDDGNLDYQHRVQQWQVASLSDGQLAQTLLPGARDEATRRQTAYANRPVSAAEEAQMDAEFKALGFL